MTVDRFPDGQAPLALSGTSLAMVRLWKSIPLHTDEFSSAARAEQKEGMLEMLHETTVLDARAAVPLLRARLAHVEICDADPELCYICGEWNDLPPEWRALVDGSEAKR